MCAITSTKNLSRAEWFRIGKNEIGGLNPPSSVLNGFQDKTPEPVEDIKTATNEAKAHKEGWLSDPVYLYEKEAERLGCW